MACGGAEPTNDLIGRRTAQPNQDPTDPTDPAADPGADPAGANGGGGANADAGGGAAGGSSDAAAPAPMQDAFTGAGAYVAQNGPSTIKGDHPFPNGNPAKQDCMTAACHGAGGEGPRFLAGGTVFKDLAGTMPAAQVEVRIRDAAGAARIARTDVNGNFFFNGVNGAMLPAKTASRDAATTRPMASPIATGACNSAACHGGPQAWIHVP